MMRVVLAVCAGAVLGLSIAVTGCEDDYNPGPESGNAKGSEMASARSGIPVTAPASAMSPGSPSAPIVFPTPPAPCEAGLACAGTDGCIGACDPVAGMITECARCENGALTACTDKPCP